MKLNEQQKISLRLIRLPEVKLRTGLSRSSIYLALKKNIFPKPISLGIRSVAWLESEVDLWISSRIEKSRP
jgi:prophage regulatory protein